MLMPLNSHAQLKFGVKGGVDITNMSLSGELLKADNRAGFFVGPTLKVMVAKPIALYMAILYNDRSVKLSQNYEDATPADLSDLT